MLVTSERIVTIVVSSIAVLACIGVGSLSFCLVNKIAPEQVLLTAYVGIISGLTGTLTGLLINTRASPAQGTSIQTTVTKTENPE